MMPLIQSTDFNIFTPLGYQIVGRLFSPRYPTHRTILLCPPPKHGMDFFLEGSPLDWRKWFLLGCSVLMFDPLGCGNSWGTIDWGGIEDKESLVGLIRWLELRNERKTTLLFISFGASILGVMGTAHHHPIIAFDPLYQPSKIIDTYPELSSKTKHFWDERKISAADLHERTRVLSAQPATRRQRLLQRKILLEQTLRCGASLK